MKVYPRHHAAILFLLVVTFLDPIFSFVHIPSTSSRYRHSRCLVSVTRSRHQSLTRSSSSFQVPVGRPFDRLGCSLSLGPSTSDEIFKSLKTLQQRAFPLIPTQENKLSIADHFRPKFAAKEFLLGAAYMTRIMWLLVLSSIIAHNISICFLPLLSDITGAQLVGVSSERSPWHVLESKLKFRFLQLLARLKVVQSEGFPLAPSQLLFYLVIGPVVEEFSYRGLAQTICNFFSTWSLIFYAWVCRTSRLLGAFSLATMVFAELSLFAELITPSMSLAMNLIPMLADSLRRFCWIPAHFAIWKYSRVNRSTSRSTSTAVTVESSDSDTQTTTASSSARRIVASFNATSSDENNIKKQENLEATMTRFLHFASRYEGSFNFGLAHLTNGGQLNPRQQCVTLQKFLGTLLSSFLVESRLLAHRRTLWGAIGAHIAFNTLSIFWSRDIAPLVLMPSFHPSTPPAILLFVARMTFFKLTMDRLANSLERCVRGKDERV